MKSLERRHNDVAKRVQRRQMVLDTTLKGIETVTADANQLGEWMNAKLTDLGKLKVAGSTAKEANEKYQVKFSLILGSQITFLIFFKELKALMKEVEGKQVVLETIEKRISNMSSELEPSEVSDLDNIVKKLTSEHCELATRLRGEMDKLSNAAHAREKFEADIEAANGWIASKLQQLKQVVEFVPLRAATVNQQIEDLKAEEAQIAEFGDNILAELDREAVALKKECDETDGVALQVVVADLQAKHAELVKLCGDRQGELKALYSARKAFEDDVGLCEKWLDEAQVATSMEIRAPSVGVLEEELAKVEFYNISEEIDDL